MGIKKKKAPKGLWIILILFFIIVIKVQDLSLTISVFFLKLIKIILFFISSKQSPNISISSYSIISMYFLPSSSVCVWSSLKWRPRYFHSHFSILIFLCQYCLIYSFLDHNEKIVLFFYLVLQSLWLVKKREKTPIYIIL